MAKGAFVFAMANPTPEIHPDIARSYAAVMATARSDFPNHIIPSPFDPQVAPAVAEAVATAARLEG